MEAVKKFISDKIDHEVVGKLGEFIAIPNQSPGFDSEWAKNGLQERAIELLVNWAKTVDLGKMTVEVAREPGRTPVMIIVVEGSHPNSGNVLNYGHLDKQPPLTELWEKGLGPFTPVLRDGKLYGRGGADDGYALFSALLSIEALRKQKLPYPRSVVLIEAAEESGSDDLMHYVDKLKAQIGVPDLVVCLDSGCGDYEHLWLTTSLRGVVTGPLQIDMLKEGVHSGDASGIVPSTFRIARMLLSRIDDEKTGQVHAAFHQNISEKRLQQAKDAAASLGERVYADFPFIAGAGPVTREHLHELVLNRTWRPTLSVTGADGLPPVAQAGNVLRPFTRLQLSLRLPPSVSAPQAGATLKRLLEENPPYGAKVSFKVVGCGNGFEAPELAPWLEESVETASMDFFKGKCRYLGEGGSIPFMFDLKERFPAAQFLIVGVLGPNSNAHAPNEFLHVNMTKGVTYCVSAAITALATQKLR